MASETPRVESFVLRFVQDAPDEGAPPHDLVASPPVHLSTNPMRGARTNWHAVVVHVQTNEEKNFTDFADAVAFMSRYVPLGDFVLDATEDKKQKTEGQGPPPAVPGHHGA